MFEHQPYRDLSTLAQLSDDELDAMADKGELSCADLMAAKFKKSLHADSVQSPPEPVANDGFNDPYVAACVRQLFAE